MLSTLLNLARKARDAISRQSERNLVSTGRLLCFAIRDITQVNSLADIEFRVYSQGGEDGIIEWLVERLAIPIHAFIEFGADAYRESNTRFLLINRNWRGLIFDGSKDNIVRITRDDIYWMQDLTAKAVFITRDNVNKLIDDGKFAGQVGLLSIDIDGNDYWVWENIDVINPIVVICEYNAVFGDLHPISIPYDANFNRTRAHFSNLYFGASIAALQLLASKKGYEFIGTNSAGVNAFFVRNDYATRLSGVIGDTSPRPSRVRESRDERGKPTYAAGLDRLNLIGHLPVVNVKTGVTVKLGAIEPLYSAEWIRESCTGFSPGESNRLR
jgi:hypothetical protein